MREMLLDCAWNVVRICMECCLSVCEKECDNVVFS